MMFVKIFFRYLSFFLILGFLIAISIIENKLVTDSMIKVNTYCFSIENYISEHEEYRTMELVTLVDNLEYNWEKGESGISFMVNHKSIHEIAVEIEKLKTYIAEDDIKEFKTSVELIKLYSHSYLHFMGANFHNIF